MTPSGRPVLVAAARSAAAASSLVCGGVGCALTTTGQPAASALAVSPPGTLNANGKLEAAKTATGPSGTFQRRSAGRGGTADGSAASSTTPRNAPASTIPAKNRNW